MSDFSAFELSLALTQMKCFDRNCIILFMLTVIVYALRYTRFCLLRCTQLRTFHPSGRNKNSEIAHYSFVHAHNNEPATNHGNRLKWWIVLWVPPGENILTSFYLQSVCSRCIQEKYNEFPSVRYISTNPSTDFIATGTWWRLISIIISKCVSRPELHRSVFVLKRKLIWLDRSWLLMAYNTRIWIIILFHFDNYLAFIIIYYSAISWFFPELKHANSKQNIESAKHKPSVARQSVWKSYFLWQQQQSVEHPVEFVPCIRLAAPIAWQGKCPWPVLTLVLDFFIFSTIHKRKRMHIAEVVLVFVSVAVNAFASFRSLSASHASIAKSIRIRMEMLQDINCYRVWAEPMGYARHDQREANQ